ncbi:sulfatase [Arundinibacter roseus]|uniref:DUF4976 domain-containing protein n=1 Tax=Arundinibacter roseus TaxID=2070510 RepID=A0A4R4K8E4_9BACT|nr:sulfatase [Arundinibacter roseus]TDB62701.1 DUF4976 domain-containing protein [Arundinibacter roseus]
MKKQIFSWMLVFFSVGFTTHKPAPEKPNFLFIFVDDLVPVLGAYGHKVVKSPMIDKLSSESVQFNRAYCNVAVCGASRASLLTGIRPHFPQRYITFTSRADKDYPSATTLPKLLKDQGYYTVSNGKVFHDADDSEHGWSEKPWRPDRPQFLNPITQENQNSKTKRGPFFESADVQDNAYSDGQLAEKSILDLQRLAGSRQPFFMAVGFSKPHLPFNAPKKYYDLYKNVPLADNPFEPENIPAAAKPSKEILSYGYTDHYNTPEFHQQARHGYYACVSYIDAQIGKVLAELKRLDLEKNTVVVLLGDHGFQLGQHNYWGKHSTLHDAIHAPLILKIPGQKPAKLDQIVEFVDLYPTFCELMGIQSKHQLHGESLLPLIAGKADSWKNSVVSEWLGARALMTDRYAFAYWFEPKNKGQMMLFDHQKDPEQNKNVAALPEYSSVVKEYRMKLDKIYKELESSITPAPTK